MEQIKTFEQSKSISWGKLLICLAIPSGLGLLCNWLAGSFNGYGNLVISRLTPPEIVMKIVWPIFYFMMGWSYYLVLQKQALSRSGANIKTAAIILWWSQLIVNLIWPFLMFKTNMYTFTFIWTAILTALITATVVLDFKISVPSALLMLPYWVWMIFTTYSSLIVAIYN